jgi:hypothetical protein
MPNLGPPTGGARRRRRRGRRRAAAAKFPGSGARAMRVGEKKRGANSAGSHGAPIRSVVPGAREHVWGAAAAGGPTAASRSFIHPNQDRTPRGRGRAAGSPPQSARQPPAMRAGGPSHTTLPANARKAYRPGGLPSSKRTKTPSNEQRSPPRRSQSPLRSRRQSFGLLPAACGAARRARSAHGSARSLAARLPSGHVPDNGREAAPATGARAARPPRGVAAPRGRRPRRRRRAA